MLQIVIIPQSDDSSLQSLNYFQEKNTNYGAWCGKLGSPGSRLACRSFIREGSWAPTSTEGKEQMQDGAERDAMLTQEKSQKL